MKRIYTFLLVAMLGSSAAGAQTFTIEKDTIRHSTDGYYSLLNNVTNFTAGNVILRWHVLATNFPASLQPSTCLCDNYGCNHDSTFFTGGYFMSTYPSGHGEMHLMGDVSTVPEDGPFYISLEFIDRSDNTMRDTATFIINKVPPTPAGVSATAGGGSLMVYPNPAAGMAEARFTSAGAGVAGITITGITGAVVKQWEAHVRAGVNNMPIAVSGLANGLYQVHLALPGQPVSTTTLRVNAH